MQGKSSASCMNSASTYLDAARNALSRIKVDQICRPTNAVARSLETGGIVHVFGTGHSSLLAQEVFYRAGGIVAINPILDPRLGFEKGVIESTEFERSIDAARELAGASHFRYGDIGLVISNSGRNALVIEMALQMKAAGLKVIALTNLEQSRTTSSRHPSGSRLFEVADFVLDNHCPPGDATVTIPGIPHAMGPVSTIVGAAILHAMFLQAAEQMAARGKPPGTFVSANVGEGSTRSLQELVAPYEERILYYRPGAKQHRRKKP